MVEVIPMEDRHITQHQSTINLPDDTNIELEEQDHSIRSVKYVLFKRLFIFLSVFLFVGISTTVGILIVCFTITIYQTPSCLPTYQPLLNQPVQANSLTRSTATGHLNGDGHLDLVVANHGSHSIGIFFGYSNGTFNKQIPYSTGVLSFPSFVNVFDMNNDTFLDVIVANYGTHSIGIFFGQGNGSFNDQITFSTGVSRPLSFAIGDLNSDQFVDIAIVNHGTQSIGISFGLQNKQWSLPVNYSTGYDSQPTSLAIGDLNNDQIQDIVVTNYGISNLGFFFGIGNGSFQQQKILSTGSQSQPYRVVVHDLNADNYLDLIIVNAGTNVVQLFYNYGNGTFQNPVILSTGDGSIPHDVTVGKMNDDNYLDIVVVNSKDNTVGAFIGSHNGTFGGMRRFSTGYQSSPQSINIADFNDDNQLDIVVANNQSNNIALLLNTPSIDFQLENNYETDDSSTSCALAVGDFNHDNHSDVVVGICNTNNVIIFLGFGNGTLSSPTLALETDGFSPVSIVTGYFDNDNHLDFILVDSDANTVSVVIGLGNGTFQYSDSYSTGDSSQPQCAAVGDFNHDHYLDIVVVNKNTNNIVIFLGSANGALENTFAYSTGDSSSPSYVSVGDFNNDTYLDVATANSGSDAIGVFLGLGNGSFASQMTYPAGERAAPTIVRIADVNNDARLDIVVNRPWRDAIIYFPGKGDGTFDDSINMYAGYQSVTTTIVVQDFNNDKVQDIILGYSNNNFITMFEKHPDGNYETLHYTIASTISGDSIVAGDFNEDKRLDLAIGLNNGVLISIVLGYDAGTFGSPIVFSTSYAYLPSSVIVFNYNQDNYSDIAVSNFGSDTIDIFLGDSKRTYTQKQTVSLATNSHPSMIRSGDLNNDGISDIAVASTGTNQIALLFENQIQTFSTSDNSQPSSLVIGDFNHDNQSDIAVANYGSNTIGVLLRFNVGFFESISLAVYSVTEALSINDIQVGDFNNDNISDVVFVRSSYNTVGIILIYSNKTFSNPILLKIQNKAQPSSIAVGDFDNDKNLDLAVTNYYYDSIGVFLGYGNGTFQNEKVYRIYIGSTLPSLAVADMNNDSYLDIILSCTTPYTFGIFYGHGDGTFENSATIPTNTRSTPISLVVSDFNNDQNMDIIVANTNPDRIGIYLGRKNRTFDNEIRLSTSPGLSLKMVTVGDLNDDGQLDIVAVNSGNAVIVIYLGDGNGTVKDPIFLYNGVASQPVHATITDINHDEIMDIVLAFNINNINGAYLGFGNGQFSNMIRFGDNRFYNPQKNMFTHLSNGNLLGDVVYDYYRIYIFFGYSAIGYLPVTTYSTGNQSSPRSIATADVNNDQHLDIVVANSNAGNIGIFLGTGYGTFRSQMTFLTGNDSMPYAVSIGDLNNDTYTDIVFANHAEENIGIFFGLGNGSFASKITYSTGFMSDPYSLVLSDLNNDTYVDIIVTNRQSNNLCLLYGDENGAFVSQTIIPVGYLSYPVSVTADHIDNDGLLDIVYVDNGYSTIEIMSKTCSELNTI
ncbi:unnamed protein product [Adineta ricciae]|uniref:Uncharacterized protein n=3 Tax=Adineta ricciae TaxID=249248 RepID=A0A815B5J5_ADIRI|nr:unnamed protein product [Adineta ricciae]